MGVAVGAWVCLAGFVVVAAPVLVAWLGEGAAEPLSDVVGVAAAGWLLGVGATVVTPDGAWGLMPVGLALVSIALAYRGGQWIAGSARASRGLLATSTGLATATAGLLAAGTATVVGSDTRAVGAVDAAVHAGLLVLIGASAGILRSDHPVARAIASGLPRVVRGSLRPALGATAVLVGASAALGTAAMVGSFGTITSLLGQLDPGVAGTVALLVLSLAYLPTIILWAQAVLVGSGVMIGGEVVLRPGASETPALPGFPVLGAVPAAVPDWLPVVGVCVVLAAGVVSGALVARCRAPEEPVTALGLQGAIAGIMVGGLVAVGSAAASGGSGPGALSSVGVDVAAVGAIVASGVALVGAACAVVLSRPRRGQSPSLSETDA